MGANNTALFVVDMQNGFMTPGCRPIIPNVLSLIDTAQKRGLPIIVTKFVNTPDSVFVKWIGWKALMQPPETDLIPELSELLDQKKINQESASVYASVSFENQKRIYSILVNDSSNAHSLKTKS